MTSFQPTRILVTGGAGFIGSNLVRYLLTQPGFEHIEKLVVLDALTYAGHLINLEAVRNDRRLTFVHGDVCDSNLFRALCQQHDISGIFHLAAESHVDRSIAEPDAFVRTNVTGTFTLLNVCREIWGNDRTRRFVHVSTDEVYGALGETGYFTEMSPYAPNSPYAASKAASDLLARAYYVTYGLNVVITNCCNNYGPQQMPEKLLPLMIGNAIAGAPLPVYGAGKQVREWLHVSDHCAGLWAAMTRGQAGERYNFGSGEEHSNLRLVEQIADIIDEVCTRPPGTTRAQIRFVEDRKGHDFRYAIDATKAERELGWRAASTLTEQLRRTIEWYAANQQWVQAVQSTEHARFVSKHYAQSSSAHASFHEAAPSAPVPSNDRR